MPKLIVRNIDPRIDGEYDLVVIDDWTQDEWHKVKKQTDLIFSDFIEAMDTQRVDLTQLRALAMVACGRDGKRAELALLGQAKLDDIELVPDPVEAEAEAEADDAGPPAEPKPSDDGEPGGEPNNAGVSFDELSEETQGTLLRLTGTQG